MPNRYRRTSPRPLATAGTHAPAHHSGSRQRSLSRARQPNPEVTRWEETSHKLQLANCHMPWQSYWQQWRAQGGLLSLAPHPAAEETHLAPCWTFIRSDLHQMVAAFWHWCRLVRCWRRGHISPQQGSPDWSGSLSTDAKTAAVVVTKAAWFAVIFYAGMLQPWTFQEVAFYKLLIPVADRKAGSLYRWGEII